MSSAQLDAELLLQHELQVTKSWLIAHSDHFFRPSSTLERHLQRRLQREPLAYILGTKEFYGRPFLVTSATLIPRPESEALVDFIKNTPRKDQETLLDIGTGSGCLAVSIALECPELTVHASDISIAALEVAARNAKALDASVHFYRSDLLKNYPEELPRFIVANLPYVDRSWYRSPETEYEPSSALFAADEGLALISLLLRQIVHRSPKQNTIIALEADPRQFSALTEVAAQYGYKPLHHQGFLIAFTH